MHSKLLINLCFALVGLYVTFIISTVSTGVPVLCGVVSALMHYFFLTVFFWMAAEAIHLHRKLVTALKPDIKGYLAIAIAICWGMLHAQRVHVCRMAAIVYAHIHPWIKCISFCSCSGSSIYCDIFTGSTLPELHPRPIVSFSIIKEVCFLNC